MPNLLPPRPGGTLAAISACPDADVIFVAHAGLDNIITVGDVWGKFPIDQVIRARWWRVPVDQVPRTADHEAQVQWLYGWWERIDTWISENRPGGVAVPQVAPTPHDETAEPVTRLTPREREVLALMAEGRSNVAIAQRLFITEKSVSKHAAGIFAKLDLAPSDDDNRRVLAVLAYLDS